MDTIWTRKIALAIAVAALLSACGAGDRGEPGATGPAGANGLAGTNGMNGTNGIDGINGTTVYVVSGSDLPATLERSSAAEIEFILQVQKIATSDVTIPLLLGNVELFVDDTAEPSAV